jgi:pectate lyase
VSAGSTTITVSSPNVSSQTVNCSITATNTGETPGDSENSDLYFGDTYVTLGNRTVGYQADFGGETVSGATIVTSASALKTAISNATAGDTIYVRSGTYTVSGGLTISKAGTLSKYITIKNYPNETPVLTGTAVTFSSSCKYINFEGFVIKDMSNLDWGTCVHVSGGASYINLRNLEITNIKCRPFSSSSSNGCNPLVLYGDSSSSINNILIENCYVHDCDTGWSEAITANGNVENCIIRNCTVDNNKNIGIDLAGNFEWTGTVGDATNQARSILVENNLVMNCQSPYATSAGLYCDGGRDNTFRYNVIYNCQCGIELGAEEPGATVQNFYVYGNLIIDSGRSIGVGGYQSTSATHKNSYIYNNTIICGNSNEENYGLMIERTSNLKFVNNIIYGASGTTLYSNGNGTSVTLQNNCWYKSSGSKPSQDSTGIFANPSFINNTGKFNGNYNLSSASPCINKGVSAIEAYVGTVDLNANARINGTIDIGAFEYYKDSTTTDTPPNPSNPSNPSTPSQPETNSSQYSVQGFATGVTGGGELDESSPYYVKVTNAKELGTALTRNAATKVVEIMNDIDLGWNMIGSSAQTSPFTEHTTALTHPTLKQTGVSKLTIDGFDGLTIFSKNGAKLTHGALVFKRCSNVMIRNLEFDELWEWDEYTKGDYDRNDWDFITLEQISGIWIDHCTFGKAYDGVVDSKKGTNGLTISWSKFLPGEGKFYDAIFDEMELNKDDYPMYKLLRDSAVSKDTIKTIAAPQKKTHLVGANELATDNNDLEITLHHNYYLNSQDRLPRLRGGNAHNYNNVMDSRGAYEASKLLPSSVESSLSSKGYNFHIVSNGSLSTEGGALLVEKSVMLGIQYPLRNNQKSASNATYTGKIKAVDTIYEYGNTTYRGNSTDNNSPLVPVPAKIIDFSWNGFSNLPYSYQLDDPSTLQNLLQQMTGAGVVSMNWLKATYTSTDSTTPTPPTTSTNVMPTFSNWYLPTDCTLISSSDYSYSFSTSNSWTGLTLNYPTKWIGQTVTIGVSSISDNAGLYIQDTSTWEDIGVITSTNKEVTIKVSSGTNAVMCLQAPSVTSSPITISGLYAYVN